MFSSEVPLLDARLEGVIFGTAAANTTSTFYYNFAGNRDFNGVDVYAWDSNPGDYLTLLTEYTTDGGTTWKRYKKFGKKWYVFPNTLQRVILFPTKPSLGVRLRVDYTNVDSSNSVKFAVNMFKFIDQVTVSPALGEEGDDW